MARLAPDNLAARSRLALTYERLGKTREAVYEYLSVASILEAGGKADRAKEALQRSLALIPGDPETNRYLRLIQQEKRLPPPSPPRGATAPLRMARVQEFLKTDLEEEKEEDSQMADPEAATQGEALTILAGLLFDEPTSDEDLQERSLGMSDITSGKTSIDRIAGSQPTMYRYLGQAIDLQTRGHKEQAIKELERAVESGLDHPAAYYNLGLLQKELRNYEDARRNLLASVGHPNLAMGANLALGRLARLDDNLSDAARYLMQALRLADSMTVGAQQSNDLNQLYDTILASQSEGNEEDLENIVARTLDFLSGPQWLQRLREARKQLEGSGVAVVPIAEMLALGGTDHVLNSMTRIDDLMEQGHHYAALEEAMLALEYAPTYLAMHQRIAEIQILSGNPDAGYAKLSTIAETHRVRGESMQASEVYSRIIEHSPVNIKARRRQVELFIHQDRLDEALQASLELADLYRQMAEIDRSRETLAEALLLSQRAPTGDKWGLKILQEMGDIDMSRLDQRSALRVYEQIKALDPADEKASGILIDLNLRLGQEEQAGAELDSHLENLVKAGKSAEALNLLEELAREHPGKQALHSRLAEAYKAAGRTADAIAQYDALGEIQLDAGQVADAIKSIQAIINLNPPGIEGYEELLRNLQEQQ
jgi:tetratricopeptide (TPR) repeat protein